MLLCDNQSSKLEFLHTFSMNQFNWLLRYFNIQQFIERIMILFVIALIN